MDLTFAYALLPGVAACAVGAGLRYASLAAAAAFGLWASLVLVMAVPGVPIFLLPLIFGGAIGATTLTLWLWLRPDAGIYSRMAVAMVAALGAGMGLLFNALGGA